MNITVVTDRDGDWIVLYVDGVKQIENHSLSVRDVLETVGIQAQYIEDVDPEPMGWEFPVKLEDLQYD